MNILRNFELKITVLLRTTLLVSNGNNIVARNFERFAAIDVEGRQVDNGNGSNCPWQQQKLNFKTWSLTFVAPYSTDNRNIQSQKEVSVKLWTPYR